MVMVMVIVDWRISGRITQMHRPKDDPFVTVADCRAMLRGVRNALVVMVPVWGVVVWWWLR